MRDDTMIDSRRVVQTALLLVGVATAVVSAQPAFQDLLDDLHSPKDGTRQKAVRAMVHAGYPEAPSVISPLIADRSNSVQLAAIDALLELALAPVPATSRATPFKPVNGSIAWRVFEGGPLAVLPHTWPPQLTTNLSAALRDDDARVRAAAAGALAVIASGAGSGFSIESRNALVTDIVYALRQNDAYTRQSAARAAGVIFTAVGDAPAPAAMGDALIAALNDDEASVRVAASEALGFVREARSEQALRDRFAFYARGPEAESALHALARIAGPSNARIFREALASHEVPYRVIAVEGLGRSRDRAAVQLIGALVQTEREPSVLVATAFAFYVLGERANLERIVSALVEPELARQARAYVTELGATAAPELVPWLRHENPAIRMAVAEVLGLSGHAASEAALQPVARGDSDPAVAEAARRAILRLRALPKGVRTR